MHPNLAFSFCLTSNKHKWSIEFTKQLQMLHFNCPTKTYLSWYFDWAVSMELHHSLFVFFSRLTKKLSHSFTLNFICWQYSVPSWTQNRTWRPNFSQIFWISNLPPKMCRISNIERNSISSQFPCAHKNIFIFVK